MAWPVDHVFPPFMLQMYLGWRPGATHGDAEDFKASVWGEAPAPEIVAFLNDERANGKGTDAVVSSLRGMLLVGLAVVAPALPLLRRV